MQGVAWVSGVKASLQASSVNDLERNCKTRRRFSSKRKIDIKKIYFSLYIENVT